MCMLHKQSKGVVQNTLYFTVKRCAGKAEAQIFGFGFWSMFIESQSCKTRLISL
jgi:hypothetical protein